MQSFLVQCYLRWPLENIGFAYKGCEEGAAGQVHSGWKNMEPVWGTVVFQFQACASMSLPDLAP